MHTYALKGVPVLTDVDDDENDRASDVAIDVLVNAGFKFGDPLTDLMQTALMIGVVLGERKEWALQEEADRFINQLPE